MVQGASTANRTFNPPTYVRGERIKVEISVTPDSSVLTYSLEETPPAGWTISGLTPGCVYVTGVVRCGTFSDNSQRTISYLATPPRSEIGEIKSFQGTANFDGSIQQIQGKPSFSIWEKSYETLLFDSVSGDLEPGQYTEHQGGSDGFYYRPIDSDPSFEQFQSTETLNTGDYTHVNIVGRAYYHEFKASDGTVRRVRTTTRDYSDRANSAQFTKPILNE